MQIEIKLLDVGDADAIIVRLTRQTGEELLIFIDAGNICDGKRCFEALDTAPDLVICTHYDADHIGGLLKVIGTYGNAIQQIWMHRPDILRLAADISEAHLITERMDRARPYWIHSFGSFHNAQKQAARTQVLESYLQLKKLDKLMQPFAAKVIAPFPGVQFPGWPEISVLGPTTSFYNDCVARIKDIPTLLNEATDRVLKQQQSIKAGTNPCQSLATRRKLLVSLVNQISLIISIQAGKHRYLFTGDASLQSFEAPHHGSHNNCSPELFSIIKPEVAAISGGKQYLDNDVLYCLRQQGVSVHTTRDSGTLTYQYPSS
jgi:beta-lactamase superfamily II metal-dependent hydrolase